MPSNHFGDASDDAMMTRNGPGTSYGRYESVNREYNDLAMRGRGGGWIRRVIFSAAS